MCHLASWVINQEPKEGHGKVWKSWCVEALLLALTTCVEKTHEVALPICWTFYYCRVAKVMRKRADIEISVGVTSPLGPSVLVS
jgi:hypothetical protein